MGMAMTVAQTRAHANEPVQFASEEIKVDRSVKSGDAQRAKPRKLGNHPLERVVIETTGNVDRPAFEFNRLIEMPVFGFCVLSPRQIMIPSLLLPGLSPICPR